MEIGASGKSFDMVVAPQAQLKDPATYTIVGTSVKRKDIPAKITAEYTYIQDLKVPGMLHGRVVRPYGIGATLLSVDETGLKEIPDFVQVVRRGNSSARRRDGVGRDPGGRRCLAGLVDPQSLTSGQAKWSGVERPAVIWTKIWDTVRAAPGTQIGSFLHRRCRRGAEDGGEDVPGDLPGAVPDGLLGPVRPAPSSMSRMIAASSIPARRCRTRRATSPRSCWVFWLIRVELIWYGACWRSSA